MSYISTRDPSGTELSYTDTLLAGLAQYRGLFVASEYPQVSLHELQEMQNAPYTQVAFEIKKKIIAGDIPDSTLRDLVDAAYTQQKFPESQDGNITPIRKIEDNFYIQNLSL